MTVNRLAAPGGSALAVLLVSLALSIPAPALSPAAAAVSQPREAPSDSQLLAPDDDIRSYVLFAFGTLEFPGGNTASRGAIAGGNVGANGLESGRDAVVDLCTSGRVTMSDDTQVVGDSMRLGDASTPAPCDVFDAFYNAAIGDPEAPRNGGPTRFTPPVIKALPPIPDLGCDVGNPLTVRGGTTTTVPPGVYGEVHVEDTSTVTLQPGVHTVCDMAIGQNVRVITPAGVEIRSERGFRIGNDTVFGGEGCGDLPQVFVAAEGPATDNAIDFAEGTTVGGHFFTRTGRIPLGKGTNLFGTFWGDNLTSDVDVNVTFCASSPTPPTDTADLQVTKRVTGATEGLAPGSTFDIGVDCSLNGQPVRTVTLSLTDAETGSVGALPADAICELDETDLPEPLPGFEFETPVIRPGVITIDDRDGSQTVDVTNGLREVVDVVGTLEVHKVVSGATRGYVPASQFTFDLDCDGAAFDDTFRLAAGETFSAPVRSGTECTVTETGAPSPRTGFVFRRPIFTPGRTVTVSAMDEPTTVEVDNPLVHGRAFLTLVKVVDNGDADARHTPDDWILTADGPTPVSGAGGSRRVIDQPVAAGEYVLSEVGPAGYDASDWECAGGEQTGTVSVAISRGDDVICTITNTARQPTPAPSPAPTNPTPPPSAPGTQAGSTAFGTLASTGGPLWMVPAGLASIASGLVLLATQRRRDEGNARRVPADDSSP